MKKIVILGLTLVFLAVFFSGCEEEIKYLFVEEFEISKADFESLTRPAINFDNNEKYKEDLLLLHEELKNHHEKVYFFTTERSTRDIVYNILRYHGRNDSQARSEINLLDQHGNNVWVHPYVIDNKDDPENEYKKDNHMIVLYAEVRD